jgi:alpha-mannosidase
LPEGIAGKKLPAVTRPDEPAAQGWQKMDPRNEIRMEKCASFADYSYRVGIAAFGDGM